MLFLSSPATSSSRSPTPATALGFLLRSATLAAVALGAAWHCTMAAAQTSVWPTKPVKIVVTFPPGGAPDTLARILADKWGQALGQTFTVDNKPGAGGILALIL
jgi:tripartite-type tricarboxylate transporter receptor subunit TctC